MKKYLLLIILLITLTLSGCWDAREVNELGLVMAVAIDKSRDDTGYQVTVQVAKPKEAGGGRDGGNGINSVWIGSAEGETIFDAIRNIAKFSSRRIMWAHNNVIIIGESIAEDDITPIVDFFSHNYELRMKTWVAVTRGEARELVSVNTGIENIPAISIARLYLYNELPAKSVRTDMVRLFRDYKSETIQPIISVLQLKPNRGGSGSESQIELGGSAVFKEDKLIGWLSPEETRSVAWIRGESNNSIISVAYSGINSKNVAVELRGIKVKIKSQIDGDIPSFSFNVTATGSITEQDFPKDQDIEVFKAETESLVEEKMERELRNSLEKIIRDFDSDVLGLGRMVHIQHKNLWNSGIKNQWPELFSKSVTAVKVDVDIESSSLFQIPIKEEKIKGDTYNESKD